MYKFRLSVLGIVIYGVGFVSLVLLFRFELPRFDYWDVVYSSTKVVVTEPGSIATYLFRGNESMMALPKLLIYLSNTVGGGNALTIELFTMLLLGVGSHALLLRILNLPVVPVSNTETSTVVCWWVVLALFWWPAVIPTYTNTWFAIQYGLTLFFGLLAVRAYELSRESGGWWLPLSYLSWLAAGVTHGTGLLLGPALALLVVIKDRRLLFGFLLMVSTGLIMWVQHEVSTGVMHNVSRLESPVSMDVLKFMGRVITPPMWESALFILIVLPLLVATAWLYSSRYREFIGKPYTPLIIWGLAVWLSIWFARGGFQSHANPHYLRFFVLLYASWAMMLFELIKSKNTSRHLKWVGGALFVIVWLKGVEAGISQASEYQEQIQAGAAVLHGESDQRESICYLYPDARKLTGVLLPKLDEVPGYAYNDFTLPRVSNELCR